MPKASRSPPSCLQPQRPNQPQPQLLYPPPPPPQRLPPPRLHPPPQRPEPRSIKSEMQVSETASKPDACFQTYMQGMDSDKIPTKAPSSVAVLVISRPSLSLIKWRERWMVITVGHLPWLGLNCSCSENTLQLEAAGMWWRMRWAVGQITSSPFRPYVSSVTSSLSHLSISEPPFVFLLSRQRSPISCLCGLCKFK